MIDMREIPGFSDDEVLQLLIDAFDARVNAVDSKHDYVGNWTPTVRLGDNDYLKLQTVRLVEASSKAELERMRATVFALHLLTLRREFAKELWVKATQWESDEFMQWCRQDIDWKRSNRD